MHLWYEVYAIVPRGKRVREAATEDLSAPP